MSPGEVKENPGLELPCLSKRVLQRDTAAREKSIRHVIGAFDRDRGPDGQRREGARAHVSRALRVVL